MACYTRPIDVPREDVLFTHRAFLLISTVRSIAVLYIEGNSHTYQIDYL